MKLNKSNIAIGALVLVILALLLNPSDERHRKAIRDHAGGNLVESVVAFGKSAAVQYQSVGVASYTKLGDEVTSVGALGLVFVLK